MAQGLSLSRVTVLPINFEKPRQNRRSADKVFVQSTSRASSARPVHVLHLLCICMHGFVHMFARLRQNVLTEFLRF